MIIVSFTRYFFKYKYAVLFGIIFLGMGCSSTRPLQDPGTNATLWVQNSAEYKGITTLVYQSAQSKLETALNVKSWTASVEQENSTYRNLPPAIILDVDETVLDNAPFQARLIKNHETYTTKKWNNWVREEQADAIPGAVQLTQEAADKGVTVFYLTNRDVSVEDATYNNLKREGFPVEQGKEVLLMKNEQADWTSAKENRRKFVAKNYRILMLFGDNLGDFILSDDITNAQRNNLITENKERFGTQWFILPNPEYGAWQNALYDFDNNLSTQQKERLKLGKLDTKN